MIEKNCFRGSWKFSSGLLDFKEKIKEGKVFFNRKISDEVYDLVRL